MTVPTPTTSAESVPSLSSGLPGSVGPSVSEWLESSQHPDLARVLHVINGEHFAGAERVQQLLGKRLPQFGYEADFACIKPDQFPKKCRLRATQIIEAPMRGRIDLSVLKSLGQHVLDRNIRLLHAHTPRSALVTSFLARQSRLPWVYHVHSPTRRDSTRGLTNRVNAWIERYAIRRCNRLITVSRSLRREMLSIGVPRHRLSVVPNGVPEIQPIAADQRMQNEHWRLGIVALMRPRKGVEVALEAFKRLTARLSTLHLNLIGSFETPEYETQVRELIDRLQLQSQVHCLGFTDDIPRAMRDLDALLLPSLFGEGMPMVVLEAMSAGVPVIATTVEGVPEVIRDGTEGYLAAPGDAESLADKIALMTSCRECWRQLSENALRRHRSQFSDQSMACGVARCYDRILN